MGGAMRMNCIRRGTTPTVRVRVNRDLTAGGWQLHLSFSGRRARVEKGNGDMELAQADGGCVLSVPLTQEDTLAFRAGETVLVQLRARSGDAAIASGVAQLAVRGVLEDGVI